jgi:hypothetical protein
MEAFYYQKKKEEGRKGDHKTRIMLDKGGYENVLFL